MNKQVEKKAVADSIHKIKNKDMNSTTKTTDKRNDGGYIWII